MAESGSVRIRHSSIQQSDSIVPNVTISQGNTTGKSKVKRLDMQKSRNRYFVLFILLIANLINYMDRYTIAGVLEDVQKYYNIDNSQAGLLQTSFIISYMFLSPVFGYIGDRFNRKWPMVFGILFWSIITLASSYVPKDKYGLFVVLRALVGVGEASYSTIAPTIIADMFAKTVRTKALSIFYFAIPVGSGLGYIVGAKYAALMGAWYWSLRITPILGLLCAFFVAIFVQDPGRGESDGMTSLPSTSFLEDLSYLLRHKTFILSTLGFTCVSFVAGGLAFWAPLYIFHSQRLKDGLVLMEPMALCFGVVTVFAGLSGVVCGFILAAKLRPHTHAADPLICAAGLILGGPFLFLALMLSRSHYILTWFFIFLAESLISLNWALVTDILLYTVIPTRRASAEALQILISHMLGDAGSPYLIGVLTDVFSNSLDGRQDMLVQYFSLQYSLYINCFVCVLGGGFFLANALFIREDKAHADEFINDGKGQGNAAVENQPEKAEIRARESQEGWSLKALTNEEREEAQMGGVNGLLPLDAANDEEASLNDVGVLVHNESQQKLVPSEQHTRL